MNIFVGSLPFNLKEAELKSAFEQYGEVASAKIIQDKFTGRSKGFGFVDMPNDSEASNAINGLNGSTLSGREIVVNQAEDRRRDDRRGGFGGSGGGYNKGGRDNNRGRY